MGGAATSLAVCGGPNKVSIGVSGKQHSAYIQHLTPLLQLLSESRELLALEQVVEWLLIRMME